MSEYIKYIDDSLERIHKQINFYKHIEPLNKEEEKRKFFSRKGYEPVFVYKPLGFNAVALKLELERLKIGNSPIELIMERRRRELLAKIELLEYRGGERFLHKSLEIYGQPSPEVMKEAERLVNIEPAFAPKIMKSDDWIREMSLLLQKHGIPWKVQNSGNLSARARTDSVRKLVAIRPDLKLSRIEADRLIVHELVHIVRKENAELQPYKVFGMNGIKSLETEEGLAIFYEDKLNVLSEIQLRRYAARTLAVKKMLEGLSFHAVYNFLLEKLFDVEEAYEITQRIFRGGGILKDYFYLEGFRKVKNYVACGGDLSLLLSGKFAVQDVPIVKELMAQGILMKPRYLPEQIVGGEHAKGRNNKLQDRH